MKYTSHQFFFEEHIWRWRRVSFYVLSSKSQAWIHYCNYISYNAFFNFN